MTQRVCAASAAAGNAAAQWQQTTATGASIAKLRERLPTRRAHWTSVITVLSVMSHMYCCAKWCSTSGKSGEHLFRLPSDHRFSIWLKYANRLELLETPREKVYKTYRLCSKHFTRDCFTSDACTRLTHEAVPSVKVHEPRLRALVHPDFYEGGAAQGPNKTLWQPHETAKVCSIHFRLEDYKEGTKGRRLKPNAVPSIFPGYPAYMQRSAERIRSKASNQPPQRYTEAFPQVASCPKSKKRLFCDAPAAGERETCAEKTSKRTSETTGCASTTPSERRTKVIVRKPLRSTSRTEPAMQQNNRCMPTSENSRRPAILHLVPAERAQREQQQQQQPSVVEEECSIQSDQHVQCIEKHGTFGTQTALTGVTLGALCDEIKLLKQRCGELQGQLNDALTENCWLKAKIRNSQGPRGT
ncbi:uncharacterized protein LOC144125247 [Amblyomma americanum]